VYKTQLNEVNDLYDGIVRRTAQTSYFGGMVGGAAALMGIGAGMVGWLTSFRLPLLGQINIAQLEGQGQLQAQFLAVCLVVGAIGAVVSVLQRITSGTLELDFNAGRWPLFRVGAFRPFIGAIVATVIYALIVADLLPIKTPAGSEVMKLFYFFGAMAFFAGFSERFAQDMLAAGQSGLAGSATDRTSIPRSVGADKGGANETEPTVT
jgi:hypothetical protein